MSHRPQIAVSLLAACLWLGGCGGPEAGDTCQEGALCKDDGEALFCESGVLRSIPCQGEGGCAVADGQVTCATAARAGDNCAQQHEGGAQCDPADADGAFKCVGGTWQPQACTACQVEEGEVRCQP